jgi:hypothetical protein
MWIAAHGRLTGRPRRSAGILPAYAVRTAKAGKMLALGVLAFRGDVPA